MLRIRSFSALACFLAGTVMLAACGGGGRSASVPVVPGSGSTVSGAYQGEATATFTFTFPKASSSSKRTPQYVSSATKSITLQVTATKNAGDNSDIFANVPAALKAVQSANFANLTGNGSMAGQCGTDPSNAGNYKCTAAFQLPIGIDTFTIASWDNTNGTGNKLSQQIATRTVVQGTANAFSVSLDANAATITVNGSGSCQNGPVGSVFGSVGTSAVTFTVAYTDAAGKTIVAPGIPVLAIQGNDAAYHTDSGTINGTGGTVGFTINQATQTFTLTPSTSAITNASVNVKATPASGSDGLSFSQTKTFAFSTGTAPPTHNFLAAVESLTATSGQVDFFNVTLGGSGGPDSFSAFSPATLAVTNSTNEGKPDVDNPQDLRWDTSGDLLIANGGINTTTDPGSMACVPVGAIATGANTSTTVSTNVFNPNYMAYDSRDGSVALANNPVSASKQLVEYLLSGNYVAAGASRNLTASGYGAFGVTEMPTLAAGTYAIALTDGLETDPAHSGTGKSKISILSPAGAETPITDPTTFAIDVPHAIAWDAQNSQLVIANFSTFHRLLSFYTVSPVAQVKTINTTHRNDLVAVSPDGHVAVSWYTSFGYPQVQVYDNTASRTAVAGPIPYNGTTTSCGSTYIVSSGTPVVRALKWLSNTKLLVALQAFNSSTVTATAYNGLYIYDITTTAVPTGYDDVSCSAFAAAPAQTGFVHLNNEPLGAAFKP